MNEKPNNVVISGIRCSEDAYNRLWIGKVGQTPLNAVFPADDSNIKKKLRELRKERTGVFWIDPVERIITVVTNEAKTNEDYPSERY